MSYSRLKPLTIRELDRIESYCQKLGLKSSDIKDIKAFYIARRNINILNANNPELNNEYLRADYEYKTARSRIYALELMNVVEEFTKYSNLEFELFDENKLKYPNMSDEENRTLVYKHIDDIFSNEIVNAKARVKEARGCAGMLILLIFIPIAITIAIIV